MNKCPSCKQETLEWVKTELIDPEDHDEFVKYQYCTNCDYGVDIEADYICVWGAQPPYTNACDEMGVEWRDGFPHCAQHAQTYDVLIRNEALLADSED